MTKNAMNTSLILRRLSLFLLTILILSGCKKDPPASLYDPGIGQGAVPTIASVIPNDSALAGVTTVTITGTNFSPVKEYNFVYFNASLAPVLQASTTQLVVKAPILLADSLGLKVAVQGIELFSNTKRYKLIAAVLDFGGLPNTVEEPKSLTCDGAGNVYISVASNAGTGLGVKKITPGGARTDFSPVFNPTIPFWSGMKIGPGGGLYSVANRNAIWLTPAAGGPAAFWVRGGGLGNMTDIDFDQQGNIWAGGGGNTSIYRVRVSDQNIREFPFTGDVSSVRYFEGALYLAAKNDTVWNIWRTRIFNADSVGPRELYFNFSGRFGLAGSANAITFASDGDMYVGTDSLAGSMVVIHRDKSSELFYTGLFKGRNVSLAYGNGTVMYVGQTGPADASKKTLRVETQKLGAPYYGRQ